MAERFELKNNVVIWLIEKQGNLMDMLKRNSIFLQVITVIIGIVALLILIRFPLTEGRASNLSLLSICSDSLIIYIYAASIAFFVAVHKTYKLLGYIRQNNLFSSNSVKTLRSIRYCAILLGISIVFAGLYVRLFHNKEDDPAGFLAICIVATIVSIIVSTAAAKFEKFLQNALNHKAVNDIIE